MREGHRPGHHPPAPGGQTAALHKIKTFSKFREKLGNFEEIVTVIGISHDHKFSARRFDPPHEGTAIS
jgi:hypothetical protein